MNSASINRILLVDDNPAIHEDFKKILASQGGSNAPLSDARSAFFGEATAVEASAEYQLDSAFQGQQALELLLAAAKEGKPYAMAFVDVRMPPGWDGVQTIKEMWKADPDLECVICTAFSDYSWSEMAKELGQSDKLLILKKPFDPVEARQLASTLTTKWSVNKAQSKMTQQLVEAEGKASAYAASLETVNQALRTGKAAADKDSQRRGAFLRKLSKQVSSDLGALIDTVDKVWPHKQELSPDLEKNRTLLNTVDGVLTFTSLEQGKFLSKAADVALGDSLRATMEAFQPRATEQGCKLELDLAAGVDKTYLTDGTSIQRLVQLLVDNSLRHSEKADIKTKAWLECGEDWASPTLYVRVSDSGPGLAEGTLGNIYEACTANEDSDSFGIGLALAKQLVHTLGGDLQYEAVAPQGTSFTFHVKLAEPGQNLNQAA
ncbi:MAG: two-component system sensor histidine kinase/response regulator [Planctomycetota bacterium]|jgi:two-component system sensor histidine kinase/response regulator